MSESEHFAFERKLAMNIAPTILGIKCGGLISMSASEFDVGAHLELFNSRVNCKGLSSRILCDCKGRRLVYVYREKMLKKQLSEPKTASFLVALGYGNVTSLEECFDRLSDKIKSGSGFPHEIGVFLGYPIDDVIGFMKNKGENFKLCGCWKVYGNEEKAAKAFANYDKCRNFLCNKLNQGCDIYQVLRVS